MNRARRLALLGCLGLALAGLVACTSEADSKSTDASDTPPQDEPTVAVTHPTHEDLSRSVSLTAEFRPYQEVDLHAKVSGYVREIYVDVGDHVKTGDVLAVLEIPELEEDIKKAEAAVLTAQQQVQSAQAAFEDTDEINTRLIAASKEAAGLIAQQDLDTSAAKNRASAADLQAAKQRVDEAKAEAEREACFAYWMKSLLGSTIRYPRSVWSQRHQMGP
jgi:multidrug efflux pump subunit AcrA (membrane-fusion protein)